MGSIRVITDETHFQTELTNAATRLVVVDFTATWCGPCQRIAPIFQQLAAKYPKAVFLKVDVDQCQETAAAQGVSAMPTFIFYRNRVILLNPKIYLSKTIKIFLISTKLLCFKSIGPKFRANAFIFFKS
uniref:Thioredoxin-like n=1 Tax=Diabrotica virgifera virgifera TaxID=50390 RepID=A0A6P7GMQ4_DIAVI